LKKLQVLLTIIECKFLGGFSALRERKKRLAKTRRRKVLQYEKTIYPPIAIMILCLENKLGF